MLQVRGHKRRKKGRCHNLAQEQPQTLQPLVELPNFPGTSHVQQPEIVEVTVFNDSQCGVDNARCSQDLHRSETVLAPNTPIIHEALQVRTSKREVEFHQDLSLTTGTLERSVSQMPQQIVSLCQGTNLPHIEIAGQPHHVPELYQARQGNDEIALEERMDFTSPINLERNESMSELNAQSVEPSNKGWQGQVQPQPQYNIDGGPVDSFSSNVACEVNLEYGNQQASSEQELLDCILLLTAEEDSNILNLEPPAEGLEDYEESETTENRDKPLYNGAPICLHESFVAILTFCLSFKLTGSGLKSLLDLISLHLPSPTIFKKSVEFFKSYFSYMQGHKEFDYYCSICFEKLPSSSKCRDCKKGKVCCLVKLSLIEQLRTMMKRKGFWSSLLFSKFHPGGSSYSDVYDGTLYNDIWNSEELGNGDTITFQWYTDGASLYSSSSTSVWPLYLTINELPFVERYKKENLLVPAIWIGPVKPSSSILVAAIYPDLQLLKSGVDFEVDGQENVKLKGIVVCGTGDTPGRSIMLNLVQFNGATSCQECEDDGVPRFKCPGVRLFPFKPTDQLISRNLEKMKEYGKAGTDQNPCKGVKGPSALSKIMPDFLEGTAIDPMHQLYGGVTKKITSSLLSTKSEDKKFSVSEYHEILDDRLMSIKPPAHVPRVPRPLKELLSWKMKELKAWLLDYSLPVLYNILPSEYFVHHASLVAASQLLNAGTVSQVSLNTAKFLLEKYVSLLADLYDPNILTMNFHLLVHLADTVKSLGPLWVYSCFPLESLNGVILNLTHGTRWAERQIASSMQICLGLPEIIKNLPENSKAKDYCLKIVNRRKFKGSEQVGSAAIIGSCEDVANILPEVACVLQALPVSERKVQIIHSIKRGKYLYVAESSKLSVTRDSSVAVYKHEPQEQDLQVGVIKTFLRVFQCNDTIKCHCTSSIYVVLQNLEVIEKFPTLIFDVFVPNVAEYKLTGDLHLIGQETLEGVCVRMQINEHLYISIPWNSKEVE